MKKFIAKKYASLDNYRMRKWMNNPKKTQKKVFKSLIQKGRKTAFGRDHQFNSIKNYNDFKSNVPIVNYEGLRPYIERIKKGEKNVLWPGLPAYFAKTSGTTSGAKYIPISKESMPMHVSAAKSALLNYIYKTGCAKFTTGKMIFLQGSPELEDTNGIPTGRLSGIVAHFVPSYLQKNRLPSWKTNTIDDWETKEQAIIEETKNANMTLFSGIPPWIVSYFEKLNLQTGKTIGELFPNLEILVTGGVNYFPYEEKIQKLIGKPFQVIQTYPASEGFIAFQDQMGADDLLLLLNNGIFYEFIPLDEFYDENPTRISIEDVQLEIDYALILNTNAGLWGYAIGDVVRFTSLKPYRIQVSGRVKHYTSAFGEHVIAHEIEVALQKAIESTNNKVTDFHVAPQVNPDSGLPYHEWFIEFVEPLKDYEKFKETLDFEMRHQNMYYDDLIKAKTLRPLVVTQIRKDGFKDYMKNIGKLGSQYKIIRLSNDRKMADKLNLYKKD